VHFWLKAVNSPLVRRTRMQGSCGPGYEKKRTVPGAISDACATTDSGHTLRSSAVSALSQIHAFPATMPALVITRNFVNCRRCT
jgi:hypothetical protein